VAVAIQFLGGENFPLGPGSGVGFYYDTFGGSVPVGSYNTRTYCTDANGVVENFQLDNVIYHSPSSCIVGNDPNASPVTLAELCNHQATLRISISNDTPITLANSRIISYDRVSINNAQSGVTCKMACIQHPYITEEAALGSGDTTWTSMGGSGIDAILSMNFSPGMSGWQINNTGYSDTEHSYWIAASCSPDSIGSKYFGLYFSTEYF